MTSARRRGGRGGSSERGGQGGSVQGRGQGNNTAVNTRALVLFVQGVLTVSTRNEELEYITKGVIANSSGNQYTAQNVTFYIVVIRKCKSLLLDCVIIN